MAKIKELPVADQLIESRKKAAEKAIASKVMKEADLRLDKKWEEMEADGIPFPKLPNWIVAAFKNAVSHCPTINLTITGLAIESICKSKIENLCFGQMQFVFNAFANCMPVYWTTSDDDFIEKRKELDLLQNVFNTTYEKMEQEMVDLRNFLLSEYDQSTWEKISKSEFHN